MNVRHVKVTRILSGLLALTITCFIATGILSAPQLTDLENRIRHSLVMLPYYSVFDWLTFRVDGVNVTLMGQVSRPTLKSDAEAAIKRVQGLETVKNEIEVLPVSPNDDRIRLDMYRAIYYHPNFLRYAIQAVPPIHIIVKSGDVTLVGVVATEADKIFAGMRANGVPGAFSVTNNLEVEK